MWDITTYIKTFTGILTIVNPLGAIPVFMSLTSDEDPDQRAQVARVTAMATAMVLITAALCGEAILHFFGISIASFRVGGGILILLMAISMLHARPSGSRHTPEEALEAESKESIAVVPLAIPILAGPGSISTVILYAHQDLGWTHSLIICGIILVTSLIVWAVLKAAVPIASYLGTTGINIIGRLMGLILAAIAVEFISNGLVQLLPVLAAR